jgi:hypothetical protein
MLFYMHHFWIDYGYPVQEEGRSRFRKELIFKTKDYLI